MDKILIINGSPHRTKSGTLKVTDAFVQGIEKAKECEVEILHLADLNIKTCAGCLSCWGRTEGECVIKNDDIGIVKQKLLEADTIIFSFPLYFFGMPGAVKTMLDRLLGMVNAYRGGKPPEGGLPYHAFRHDLSEKRLLVVSTCGYCQVDKIYDPLLMQLDCIFGKKGYQALLCPQGKIFSTPAFDERSRVYLEKYVNAGVEFADRRELSEETLKNLQVPMLNDRRFSLVFNKFWEDEFAAGKAARENKNV